LDNNVQKKASVFHNLPPRFHTVRQKTEVLQVEQTKLPFSKFFRKTQPIYREKEPHSRVKTSDGKEALLLLKATRPLAHVPKEQCNPEKQTVF
jgi:hypothetical protein